MKFSKFIIIPVMIAVLAALIQVADQLLCTVVEPSTNRGFSWLAFQAWALYFVAGCTVKGGIKTFLAYVVGVAASIVIMIGAGWMNGLGFWAVPASLLIFVIPVICLEKVKWLDFIPGIFIGAGAFFAFMTYVPNASFENAAVTEMIYCSLGLLWGWMTVTLRTKYEKAVNDKK